MIKKLLVICGPTAVGKTKLAIHLSKLFEGEIISADSRQIYRGMDIGTGKDLPVNSNVKTQNSKLKYGYYEIDGVRIWGYDLILAKDNFSVAQYVEIAREIIKDIWSRNKLPILVGGTGLYIKGVIDGIETVSIPPNLILRKSLEGKGVDELYEILASSDPLKAASMNISDRKNPRRLVRGIEIASDRVNVRPKGRKYNDVLFIGLTAPKEFLFKRIEDRVYERLKSGFEDETKELLKDGISWNSQAMQSLGYRQFRNYFEGDEGRESAIKNWIKEEKKYAKRQITWFKRDKRIIWYDIKTSGWERNVERLVKKWYKMIR